MATELKSSSRVQTINICILLFGCTLVLCERVSGTPPPPTLGGEGTLDQYTNRMICCFCRHLRSSLHSSALLLNYSHHYSPFPPRGWEHPNGGSLESSSSGLRYDHPTSRNELTNNPIRHHKISGDSIQCAAPLSLCPMIRSQ